MYKCPVTKKIVLEESDIKIGEIYKKGKENYLVLEIRNVDNKVRSFTKEDIEKYGEYRIENTLRMCLCKKTTELNTQNFWNILPSSFQYKHNQDSFNKILELSDEEMSEIITAIEEKEEDFQFDKHITFEDKSEISIIFKDKFLFVELFDKNGNEIETRKLKRIDFEQKIQLKNGNNKYSFIIVEK